MARGGTKKQDTTFNESQGVFNNANQNASNLSATLTPMYQSEATNPTGTQIYSDLNTAGQQSTGGSTAAVKGQAGLSRLRTGNRGTSQAILDESVRNAMRQNSNNSLRSIADIHNEGVSGLSSLYGTNVNQTMAALGLGGNIANNQASQPGWFQNMTSLIASLGGAGAKGVTL